VRDSDGLTHLRYAWLYATRGWGFSGFPWLTCSVVRTCGADDWYGFHLLLLPFTRIANPLLQIQMAGTAVTCAALLILWWALRLLRVRGAWLWPLVMAVGSPATANRYAMLRPQVLSNALGLLLLPLLARGRLWQIALLGAVFTFVHFNVFWMLPLIAGVYAVVKYCVARELPWQRFLAVLAGEAVGWVLRPNPLGAARLVWIQTVTWSQAHLQGVALETPRDMIPMPLSFLQYNFTPVLVAWLLVTGVWFWLRWRRPRPEPEPRGTLLWTGFLLALFFFELSTNAAARASDQWLLFGFTFVALALTSLAERPGVQARLRRRPALGPALAALGVAAALGTVAWSAVSSTAAVAELMPSLTRLQPACDYLRGHAPPGAVVFSTQWGLFPELFFWDPNNYYIGGMDPIFQYAYSPELFWKAAHMAESDGATTCGTPTCVLGAGEDSYTVLKRDFHASYVLLERGPEASLCRWVQGDPRFAVRFTDGQFLVAELIR
jgi:hypothetical protein